MGNVICARLRGTVNYVTIGAASITNYSFRYDIFTKLGILARIKPSSIE